MLGGNLPPLFQFASSFYVECGSSIYLRNVCSYVSTKRHCFIFRKILSRKNLQVEALCTLVCSQSFGTLNVKVWRWFSNTLAVCDLLNFRGPATCETESGRRKCLLTLVIRLEKSHTVDFSPGWTSLWTPNVALAFVCSRLPFSGWISCTASD
jgi:hypothetical protein